MKKLLLVIVLFITCVVYSQNTERKYLFTNKYGVVNFEIINRISESNSNVYSVISFQNTEYKSIIDTRIILISKKSELKEFAEKLIEFSEKEKGVELSFVKKDKYSINLFSDSNNIILMDKENKFNYFSKKQAKNLAQDIISNIDLLKD
ncbi:hypothetical protein OX284_003395 [Flavobacterium sp. SUN046]|uniref:hypothetical protein n=1 Tax=Flavobacterium sp. SUN046 TaxID=3002440 RepID=UPI002DBC3E6F|nr:hypothetical protein [Flavobacterium sp. SUN046]MEC4048462.1 hypothetical protein [Flavobacterium sp. SUN046]